MWSEVEISNVFNRYQQFKDFQKRILVATNLFGRGMDIERVNIVFNYDMPEDTDTYLHRVARAGRLVVNLYLTLVLQKAFSKLTVNFIGLEPKAWPLPSSVTSLMPRR